MKRALACLVAIVAALGLIHLWPDESPLPETQIYRSLLTPTATPKSWFLGAHGFLSEGDIFASGQRFAATFRQSGTATAERYLAVPEELVACMKATPICAEALPQDELLELLASNQALLEHYLALYTASDFANVLPPGMNSPVPRFDGIFAAQQLLLAALLNEADAGKALQAVDRDLAYWRRVLAGTNVFISKMAAVRGASRALMVRGKLMERLDSPALRSLPPMPPLSPSEWAMRDAIRFEMGIDYTVMQDLPLFVSQNPERDLGPYALLPMKPNATFNRHQQNHASILAMADLPASEFAHAHVALAPKLRAITWWDRIFNGKGIWILRQADATDLFGQYTFAVHDFEAQIALTNLKQQLLATGLSGDPLQQVLAESPIRNPYRAEEGGRWDEATSELSFDTRPGAPSPSRLPLRVSISKRVASGR